MAQPRTRGARRRVTTLPSFDEEDSSTNHIQNDDGDDKSWNPANSKPSPLPSRTRTAKPALPSSPSTAASTPSTPQSTSKKAKRANAKAKSPDQSKTRTLFSFFNVATQRQQQSSAASATGNVAPLKEEDVEDAIQDAISDEGDHNGALGSHVKTSSDLLRPKKRLHDGLDPHGLISGSQKYIKRLDGTRDGTPLAPVETDLRPWNEKYGPTELGELVVHKKKVSDVRAWLERALGGHKYSKLLILKGAAGSGKTATLSMLSLVLNFDIVEWRNPTSSDHMGPNFVPVSAQFEDFLGRGSRFGGLDLVSASGFENEALLDQKPKESSNDRQVLVMEEFPNNLIRATAALQSFRSTLAQFLEADAHRTAPLVMVISETVTSDSNSSVDSFTAHRLLGPDTLHHPNVAMIEFNRVAPTFIAKALNLTLQKHHRDIRNAYRPSDVALKKLSEFGDVRNAISTLEFLCTQRGDFQGPIRPLKSKPKSRSVKSKASISSSTNDGISEEELSIISLRESSIGLFHAVGRVLYNKRTSEDIPASSTVFSSIPDRLSHSARQLVSEVDLDSLIDETGTDTSTFLSALHENYLLSCFSPDGDPETTMNHIIGCLDALADADLLSSDYSYNASNIAGSSGLRQSELSFQTAVRGLLFNLPYPVKRQAPPGKGKADAHLMFYPTSLKLWRSREETQGLIEMFVQKALSGTLLPHFMPRSKSLSAGIATTQPIRTPFMLAKPKVPADEPQNTSSANGMRKSEDPAATNPPRVIVGSGHSARHEMLLERLPYMKQIFARKEELAGSSLLKQMDQVIQFSGVGALQDDDDEAMEEAKTPAADGNTSSPAKNGRGARRGGTGIFGSNMPGKRGGSMDDLAAVEKLVLSDDDIVDD